MSEHLPALLVVVPILASIVMLFASYISQTLMRWLAILVSLSLVLISIITLLYSIEHGALLYSFGGWEPPWGIGFIVDPMSAIVVVVINTLACMSVIYGGAYLSGMHWVRIGSYYTLFFLMVTGMTGMVISADLFNIFVFMEVSSLATYVLIAFSGKKATFSAFRYLIVGSVGATFYLLSIAYIYGMTGSLYFVDVAERIQPFADSMAMIVIMFLMVVGFGIKMALFPMHGWLPDAHTYAPSTISAMISGVMIKVPAFVIFKIFYYVLGIDQMIGNPILVILAIIAAVSMIYGSAMALLQREAKRMLAYSSVAQIGYVVLGFSMGGSYAIIGGLLHIVNHAIMKSCLFFIAGAIKWEKGKDLIDNFKGLGKTKPITMAAFTIAAFSMIGLPPTAGFFSKWYLIKGALDGGYWYFIVVILISSLLNAIYFFRIIEKIYLQDADEGEQKELDSTAKSDTKQYGGFELPLPMLIPIAVLGIAVLVVGIFNEPIVTYVIETALGGVPYGR